MPEGKRNEKGGQKERTPHEQRHWGLKTDNWKSCGGYLWMGAVGRGERVA